MLVSFLGAAAGGDGGTISRMVALAGGIVGRDAGVTAGCCCALDRVGRRMADGPGGAPALGRGRMTDAGPDSSSSVSSSSLSSSPASSSSPVLSTASSASESAISSAASSSAAARRVLRGPPRVTGRVRPLREDRPDSTGAAAGPRLPRRCRRVGTSCGSVCLSIMARLARRAVLAVGCSSGSSPLASASTPVLPRSTRRRRRRCSSLRGAESGGGGNEVWRVTRRVLPACAASSSSCGRFRFGGAMAAGGGARLCWVKRRRRRRRRCCWLRREKSSW